MRSLPKISSPLVLPWTFSLCLLLAAFPLCAQRSEDPIVRLLAEERKYTVVAEGLFNQLGWPLPDEGRNVKRLADAASAGAFDPKLLEALAPEDLGYRARWHVLRYKFYNLEWDITGLELTPGQPLQGAPTLAIINGGSANWYEFFVDPHNEPGLGQYLAQKAPVILITIPGNYKQGGWTEPYDQRVPEYLLGQHFSPAELKVRNAVYTFRVIAEGVRQLLEKTSSGPLLIVGHSTGGELQFMLKNSSLKSRLNDRSLGWGTGPPADIKRSFDENRGARAARIEEFQKLKAWQVRGRSPEGYVSSHYIGPLNPVRGASDLEVARGWFELERRRRPQFKQVLQDLEHQGTLELEEKVKREVRDALEDNPFGVKTDEVLSDLFSPSRSTRQGYRKMVWVVAKLDTGHWDKDPDKALESVTAEKFRQANPTVPIRVLQLDAPMTHYGHIEKPRQVAAVLVSAARWVTDQTGH